MSPEFHRDKHGYKPVARHFVCEKCGKRIIRRRENGIWYFTFGQPMTDAGNLVGHPPVEMLIYGSIRMRCLSKNCRHWNTLNFYPFMFLDFNELTKKKLDTK